jgi:pimeloyl-ACP methyl ester carboxylesterase
VLDRAFVIEPFVIAVPEPVLEDMRDRLARTRWPDQIAGTGWDYGTDLAYLQDLCDYWAHRFDWRATEARLNSWANATTDIDGQRIHFIHAPSDHPGALPLLVLHGWPGSVTEMVKIIEPLRNPLVDGGDAADSFDVVCASLPGFGFSGPTSDRGWHPRRIAAAMVEMMDRLGYHRFGCLGGDWGATTSNYMALDFPDRLCGLYLTMVATGPPPGSDGSELSDEEQQWLAASTAFFVEEAGYLQIQGTRPQTLAYGLNDSPAGLAGWLVEKFRAWSDCNGDLESAISRDDILADVTLYWVTGTANSASRIYLEAMRAGQFQPITERIEVPTGAAIFPKETVKSPRPWAEAAWNIKRWTAMPKGGHFAALEVPDLLVADVRAFYRDLRSSAP